MHPGVGSTSILLALSGALLAPSAAVAVTKCSATASPTTGVLSISASPVAGTLLWGDRPDAIAKAFANAATCIDAGKAKGCELGATSPIITREAITPPDLCTIYVDDGSGPCAAFVKGCTPAARGGFGHGSGGRPASPPARECFPGEIYLSASSIGGLPAEGQLLVIGSYIPLWTQIGNRFGGDPIQNSFALPDLRGQAPDGLTYMICR